MTLMPFNRLWSLCSGAMVASIFLSLTAVAAPTNSYGEAEAHRDLQRLIEARPSINVIFDAESISRAAKGVLSDDQAQRLRTFMENRPERYVQIHRSASARSAMPGRARKKAVVSGASVSGLVAAAILSKAGYEVEIFERRSRYTRNILWAGRQGLIDELASIDQSLADRFISEVAGNIDKGTKDVYPDGRTKKKSPSSPGPPNPIAIPKSGDQLMLEKSAVIIEARAYELFLKNYLVQLPNVKFTEEKLPPIIDGTGRGDYRIENGGPVDLIVIAEGSGSETLNGFGIQRVAASPKRLQLAGLIHLENGGEIVKHRRLELGPQGPEIYITGAMSRKDSNKTWVVADIAGEEKITPHPSLGLRPGSKEYEDERQRLINEEFTRHAAQALKMSPEQIKALKIEGPVEGSQPTAFHLEQHVSTANSAGSNVVFIGDAVANGHWSVGGGMQTAAVSHAERLKTLLLDLDLKENKQKALQKFSQAVQQDSLAWLARGIRDFYPQIMKTARVSGLFMQAIAEWRSGRAQSPLEALRSALPDDGRTQEIRPSPIACHALFAN